MAGMESMETRLFVLEQQTATERRLDARITMLEEHMMTDKRVDKYMLRFIALLATMKFLGLDNVQNLFNMFHPINLQQASMLLSIGVGILWVVNIIINRAYTPPPPTGHH